MKRILPLLLLLTTFTLVVVPAYSAFGTIDKVTISAPSSGNVDQPIQVEATIWTTRTG